MLPAKYIASRTVLVSILLFTATIFFNGYYTTPSLQEGTNCSIIIFTGWLSAFAHSPQFFCWLANPLLFTGWFMMATQQQAAWILCVLAMLCSSSFLLFHSVVMYGEYSYSPAQIFRIGAGYWLWCVSIFVALAGSIAQRVALKKEAAITNVPVQEF